MAELQEMGRTEVINCWDTVSGPLWLSFERKGRGVGYSVCDANSHTRAHITHESHTHTHPLPLLRNTNTRSPHSLNPSLNTPPPFSRPLWQTTPKIRAAISRLFLKLRRVKDRPKGADAEAPGAFFERLNEAIGDSDSGIETNAAAAGGAVAGCWLLAGMIAFGVGVGGKG